LPAADTALLAEAAREAGEVARRFYKRDPKQWDKSGDQGPVTEADLAVDELLKDRLRSARPDYGWLSEETPDATDRLEADRVFIVDPIDGTRAFIEGNPTWSHSLAVVERGAVVAAVVFLPMHDLLYAAHAGGGATVNGEPMAASSRDALAEAEVLAARPAMDAHNWIDAQVPDVKRQFRSSLAYRMAMVAEGRKDAMLTLRATWEWDVAAGALLVAEAGGIVTDRKGAPLAFNNPHPQVNGVVAGGAAVQEGLIARLL
jgi:myo-inositol-1(or 4)-monophosphatase